MFINNIYLRMDNNKNNVFHETIIHKLCFIIRTMMLEYLFIYIVLCITHNSIICYLSDGTLRICM